MKASKTIAVLAILLYSGIASAGRTVEIPFNFPDNWTGRPDSEMAVRLYEEGISLLVEDNIYDALEILGKSVDADPFNGPALPYLIAAFHEVKNEEFMLFGKKLRNRMRNISMLYPENHDFEYMQIILSSSGAGQTGDELKKFLVKYPEHMNGTVSLANIYFSWDKGISNVELGRNLLRRILWKKQSWAAGWKNLGDTYTYQIHKKYIDTGKAESCLKLSFLLGEDFDFRLCSKWTKNNDAELTVNIIREYWKKYRLEKHANCRYGDELTNAYCAIVKKDRDMAYSYLIELKKLLNEKTGYPVCNHEALKLNWVDMRMKEIQKNKTQESLEQERR